MIETSVIMPVLNAERYLRDALASVVAQKQPPREIIVVDGASTDATPQIVHEFPQARYVRQTGTGLWSAVNDGIALAQGQAVAFLASDDIWAPDKLRLQGEWLLAHPETLAVFCHARFQELDEGSPLAAVKPELFGRANPAYMPEAMLARRTLFDRLGLFPQEWLISGDIDWFGRMFDSGAITHMLPDVLVTKRFHGNNLSTTASSAGIYNAEVLQIMRQRIMRRRTQGGQT